MAECLLLKAGGGGVDCDAATAMKSDVLAGKTFGGKDSDDLQTGTMVNNGAKTASLNCGGSYTIPAGYHNGSGKIIANSLASQTSANAAAWDIIKGKTAWVSGSKRTGTLDDRSSQTAAVSVSSSTSGGLVRIPFGAYRTKAGSGYPEIVLNKSQIDYIAKQRYGGVAFNGATFDGIMLSGVANKPDNFRLVVTKSSRSTDAWKVIPNLNNIRMYMFVMLNPTVDLTHFSKIRLKGHYYLSYIDSGSGSFCWGNAELSAFPINNLHTQQAPNGSNHLIYDGAIYSKDHTIVMFDSFISEAVGNKGGDPSTINKQYDVTFDVSKLNGHHLLAFSAYKDGSSTYTTNKTTFWYSITHIEFI